MTSFHLGDNPSCVGVGVGVSGLWVGVGVRVRMRVPFASQDLSGWHK